MKYFDIYEDTLKDLAEKGGSLGSNSGAIDLDRTDKYEHYGQYFALWKDITAFSNEEEMSKAFYETYLNVRRILDEQSDRAMLCLNSADLKKSISEKKSGIFLSAEDVASFGSYADDAYDLGFRVMCIMGVHETKYGYSTAVENKGLKDAGKDLVKNYLSHGMVIDCAHMSEAGFYDVLELTDRPVIASHANSKAVYNHHRNLTDDLIKQLIARKGLMGIIPFHTFMTADEVFTPEHVIRHVDHILELGGEDILSFGGDLDGIDGMFPRGFYGIQSMDYLYDEFLKAGYKESVLDKMFYQNAYEFTMRNL